MAKQPSPANGPAEELFVISRQFTAPRALLFDVWTRREHLIHWWGPKNFKVTHAELDLRQGGRFHYCLLSPDGAQIWGKFLFREIRRPERLDFISSFSDAEGGLTRHPMAPDWPAEMHTTVTFQEQAGTTTVTVTSQAYHATELERAVFAANFKSMLQGWGGTFDQLGAYLATVA